MAKKKRRGRGGIRPVKGHDLYVARYTVETYEGPKRRAVYAKTYEEAEILLNQALADRDKGLVFDAGAMTVAQYMNRWLVDCARGRVAYRTYDGYEQRVQDHINPGIGRIKLAKLSPANIQALYNKKLANGLSPGTMRAIYAVLHGALEQAVRWELIPRNPAASVDPPKLRQEEITPLDTDQACRLLEAAKGDRFDCLYVLALMCGIRRGELLGLRWGMLT